MNNVAFQKDPVFIRPSRMDTASDEMCKVGVTDAVQTLWPLTTKLENTSGQPVGDKFSTEETVSVPSGVVVRLQNVFSSPTR